MALLYGTEHNIIKVARLPLGSGILLYCIIVELIRVSIVQFKCVCKLQLFKCKCVN